MAHDEKEVCVVGDFVRIDASRKWSKNKNFKLGEIVRPAQRVMDAEGNLHSEPSFLKEAPENYNLDNYK